MAKYNIGILGPISGKVGTVVGSRAHGVHYLRAYVPRIANPRTARQVAARNALKVASRIATHLVPTLRAMIPKLTPLKAHNLAVQGLVKEGKLEGDGQQATSIVAAQVRMLTPPLRLSLPPIGQLEAQLQDRTVTVRWQGAAEGLLRIAVCSADGAQGAHIEGVNASDASATLTLPRKPSTSQLLAVAFRYDPGTGAYSHAAVSLG